MKQVGAVKVLIPLAGLIDKKAELARLEKEMNNAVKESKRLSGKLGNDKFVVNAPAEIVEKEKQKLALIESTIANIQAQKEKIDRL